MIAAGGTNRSQPEPSATAPPILGSRATSGRQSTIAASIVLLIAPLKVRNRPRESSSPNAINPAANAQQPVLEGVRTGAREHAEVEHRMEEVLCQPPLRAPVAPPFGGLRCVNHTR